MVKIGRPGIPLEEFQRRVRERFPHEEFEVIKYTTLGKPLEIKCLACGEVIKVKAAGNFMAKNKRYGCKNCYGYWKEREKYLDEIKQKYDIVDCVVKGTHKYYTIRCKKCGHIRQSTLRNLWAHLNCGCETGVYRGRSGEEFIQHVNAITLDSYELVGQYINQGTKVKVRHHCGLIFEVWPHDATGGHISCPHCHRQQSRGENIISNYLLKRQVDFEREHALENRSRQRFDFYLKNDKIAIAIEYNGAQHYKETNFFKSTLNQRQEADRRKRQFCREHNIILYEIPYTLPFKKIPLVLDGILNRFNDYPNGVDSSESKSCLSIDRDG